MNCIAWGGGVRRDRQAGGAGAKLLIVVRCLWGKKVVLDGQVSIWVSKAKGKERIIDRKNGRAPPLKTLSQV